ncbi:MAG: FtsX-like permease family protein [Acidobacteria bacterium]|nr:FtsX-like permease family protein [Acidobacteriota bacterium]
MSWGRDRIDRASRALLAACKRDDLLSDLEAGAEQLRRERTDEAVAAWYSRQLRRSALPVLADTLGIGARRTARAGLAEGRGAVRALCAAPGFSVTSIAILSLGIGISVAAASAFQAVLLAPLPYEAPDRLASLNTLDSRRDTSLRGVPGPDVFEALPDVNGFAEYAAFDSFFAVVGFDGQTRRVEGAAATSSALGVVGLTPRLGRFFSDAEDSATGAAVVVLSERFWRAGFGADPIGQTLSIDDVPHTIIGVAPSNFELPTAEADLWVPMGVGPASYNRRAPVLDVIARLAPGTSLQTVQGEIEAMDAALALAYPETHANRRFLVTDLHERLRGSRRGPLMIILLAAGFLLLVSTLNAASLQQERWNRRAREIATRRALGASSARLMTQLVFETGLLAVAAVPAALGVASGLVSTLRTWAPAWRIDEVAILDSPIAIGFALACAALVSGIGLIPVAVAALVQAPSQRDDWRSSPRASRSLVVAQVGAAALLATSSIALLSALSDIADRDRGIDASRILVGRVDLPSTRYPTGMQTYPDWPEVHRFAQELMARLDVEPGVVANAMSSQVPASAAPFLSELAVQGMEDDVTTNVQHVTPNWFDVLGLRLVDGRRLTSDDTAQNAYVAVVNVAFAQRLGGIDRALGARFTMYGREREVVGVVSNTDAVGQGAIPSVLLPFAQAPNEFIVFALRTDLDPATMAASVRTHIREIDAALAPYEIESLPQFMQRQTAGGTRMAGLIGLLAVAATILGASGVLATLSRAAEARRKEVGIRLALGARPIGLFMRVVGEGVLLICSGLLIALPLFMVSWTRLAALAPETPSLSIASIAAAATAFLLLAVVSSWIPAWRAARVAPATAIKDG